MAKWGRSRPACPAAPPLSREGAELEPAAFLDVVLRAYLVFRQSSPIRSFPVAAADHERAEPRSVEQLRGLVGPQSTGGWARRSPRRARGGRVRRVLSLAHGLLTAVPL